MEKLIFTYGTAVLPVLYNSMLGRPIEESKTLNCILVKWSGSGNERWIIKLC